jgi:hypothetical protein
MLGATQGTLEYTLSKDMSNAFGDIMKHDHRKSQEMQTVEGCRRSLELTSNLQNREVQASHAP